MSENNEININGFKIRIDELFKEKILPNYFSLPLIIQWEITRKCNLKCVFCYNNSGKKLDNELNHNERINITKQIVNAKIYRVCISGGEPILCSSFWNIAKILKKGNIFCNTITNGWHVNEDNASLYVKYFSNIQISLDGIKQETHDKLRCKKGSWNKAVNACKLIKFNNGNYTIATVVNSHNIDEIEKIIDLAYALGASSIILEEIISTGRAAKNIETLELSKKQYTELVKIIKNKKKEYSQKEMIIDLLPKTQYSYTRGFAKIPPLAMYISPTGCCGVDQMIPFFGGNIKEKKLLDIWKNLRECHKDEVFIKHSLKIKTSEDFKKLEDIPYIRGELYD